MKKIFYNSGIAKTLLCLSDCHTIMLFGFVFSKLKEEEMTQSTKNHESVHVRQWAEMTISSGLLLFMLVVIFGISSWWLVLSGLTFYLWYIIEYFFKSIHYSIMIDPWTCDLETPYESISFEREARKANKDSNYLENSNYFDCSTKVCLCQ